MKLETERLIITEFTAEMSDSVHRLSLDEDNRRFVPDEVFKTPEEAKAAVEYLMTRYAARNGPLVYPVLLKDGTYIGYVQAVSLEESRWEIGYHIGKPYTNRGYATEAVRAFLPFIIEQLNLREMTGICLAENKASVRVMERCGFVKEFEGSGCYQGKEAIICKFVYRL